VLYFFRHAFKSAEILAVTLFDSSHLDGPILFVATCLTVLSDYWNSDTSQPFGSPTEAELISSLIVWNEKLLGVSDRELIRPRLSSAWNNFIPIFLKLFLLFCSRKFFNSYSVGRGFLVRLFSSLHH
jgi:hypothetical protein